MAEATVFMVLTKLGPMIEEMVKKEIKLHLDAESETKNLLKKLMKIKEVLADAEQKGVTNPAVKAWLEKLQNIAYDIDDVLDEWEHERLKQEFEEMEERSSNPSSSSDTWEKVVSFLQSLYLCFNHVVDRRSIAVTVRELNERLDSVAEDNEKEFRFVLNLARPPYEFIRLDSTPYVDEDKVKGRDEDVRALVDKLAVESGSSSGGNTDRSLRVISIIGPGGMGKTTLAQCVFGNSKVQNHFAVKSWVCVSNPFDQTKIAKAILEDLGDQNARSSSNPSLVNMLNAIEAKIQGKRFLLVLDDVWLRDEEVWEPLKICLTKGDPGSRILVTTRDTEVAETMGSSTLQDDVNPNRNDMHPLGRLSDSHCWSILSQIAFRNKNEADRGMLQDVGFGIAKKSNGLPLAARFMGGLLRSTSDQQRWLSVLNSEVWELEEARESLFPSLRLSYNELDPIARRCFSYCAILPKASEMEVDKLTRIWMAQGFIPGGDASEVEFNARKYFDDLAARSFFQDFKKDGECIVSCKMHDIVHDFAQFLTKNECVTVVGNTDTIGPNMASEVAFQSARHVNLVATSALSVFHTENLRSFFFSKNETPQNLFNQLKRVRVLRMYDCGIEHVPKEIGELIHLRYLDLGRNKMKELPGTICDLFELQTLDLSLCMNISQILQKIEKLQNLRHILNEGFSNIMFPKGLEKLTNLRTLGQFQTSDVTKLCYLKDLNQLRSLRIFVSLGDNVHEAEEAALGNKQFLEELFLFFPVIEGFNMNVMEALQPPQILRSLEIKSKCIPNWMFTLTNLRELNLVLLNRQSPPALYQLTMLPVLEKLSLWKMSGMTRFGHDLLKHPSVVLPNSVQEIEEESSSVPIFSQLKELKFSLCDDWEEWDDDDNFRTLASIFPCLQMLTILECSKLKALPHRFLRDASSLKFLRLEVRHLYGRYNKYGEDRPRISHIPHVEVRF